MQGKGGYWRFYLFELLIGSQILTIIRFGLQIRTSCMENAKTISIIAKENIRIYDKQIGFCHQQQA
jgi:hypothetical protein